MRESAKRAGRRDVVLVHLVGSSSIPLAAAQLRPAVPPHHGTDNVLASCRTRERVEKKKREKEEKGQQR